MGLERIPAALRELNQWVCASHGSKTPMQAERRKPASVSDPSTWTSFDIAAAAVRAGRYDFVGFVFNGNGIVGIDIDAGLNAYGGLTPMAHNVIYRIGSYTERSRSGRGFHVFVRGTLPYGGFNNREGLEMYQSGRYFIMTGDSPYAWVDMREDQESIDHILSAYFPEARAVRDRQAVPSVVYNPVWQKPSRHLIALRPDYPVIVPGSRNISLASLAGQLHSTGYARAQVFTELAMVNRTACVPPLSEAEVETIVRSVTRYRR